MKKLMVLIVILLTFIGCGKEKKVFDNSFDVKEKKYTEEKFLFGTYIKMIVFSENKDKAYEAMNAAFDKIGEIDNRYNSKTKNSLIYKLNHSDNREISLDDEGMYLFNEVKRVYDLSDGRYDISISPLLDLWGFGTKERDEVPSQEEIKETLKNIGFDKVVVEEGKLTLKEPIKQLDTGSFLKGYAIEQGRKVLEEKGIKNGFVTSISSITTIDGKPNGQPWKIGIQDPSNLQNILGVVEIRNKSLGISGDYQTYVEIQGKKYHHIMDKRTGYPVSDKKLVVVVCDSAFYADMYSTAFFNMKISDIFEEAKRLNVEVLIIDSENNIQTTRNFHLNK